MAQDTFAQLVGTMRSIFHFGGPTKALIRPATSDLLVQVLESRLADDSDYTNHRGADPIDDQDFTTKQYVDALAASNSVKSIRFSIGLAAAQSSVATIPTGSVIQRASIKIATPYDNAATITVGTTLLPAAYMDTADSTPTAPANSFFLVDQDTPQGLDSTVEVAITGVPTTGTATVTVYYSTPLT